MRAYERLIEYTKYATASSEATGTTPSTPNQLIFARALVEEMKALGIADAVIKEPDGGAHNDKEYVFRSLDETLADYLEELRKLPGDALVEDRFQKYMAIGEYEEQT